MKFTAILIWLLATYNSLWASASDYSPFEFSDSKPKTKCVFGANLFTFEEWIDDSILNKMDTIDHNFSFLLSGGEFKTTTSYHMVRNVGVHKCDFIYGRFDASQKLVGNVFFHIEYSHRSKTLHLLPSQCAVLEYNSPAAHMDLSWRYVNAAYRWSLANSTEDKLFVESLPEIIKEKGLEESFIRIGVVVNDDYTYSFYNVFENGEEERRGNLFLAELRTRFKSEEIITECL